jgi:predicted TIM-barrel fold metal-dependent hydrolase
MRMLSPARLLFVLFMMCGSAIPQAKPKSAAKSAIRAAARGPVIDMHLHAMPADAYGPPPMGMCTPIEMPVWDQREPYEAVMGAFFTHPACADPVWSPKTDDELMQQTIAQMKQSHVVLGMLSGGPKRVAQWKAAAPAGLFLSGLELDLKRDKPEALASLHTQGALDVLAEITTQYDGIAPTDARLEPYWAAAEAMDVPVGIHMGPGPPGAVYAGNPAMRARLGSALEMEEVLAKHPKLRVYLMHAGYPKIDDLLALLYAYPQVYVDTGVIVYTQPRAAFYGYLKQITDAGFGKRVMFGSDQMIWPGTIERSIRVIEEDPYLTKEHKRDVLYGNAARFLRMEAAR